MNLKRWLILMTEDDVSDILKLVDRNIFIRKLLELKKDSRGSSDNVRVSSDIFFLKNYYSTQSKLTGLSITLYFFFLILLFESK